MDCVRAVAAARPRVRSCRSAPRLVVSTLAILSLVCAVLSPALADEVAPALHTTLEVIESRYLSVSVENTGDTSLTLDVRDTPLDPVQAADVVSISRPVKGWSPLQRLAYTGRVAKRLPPAEADRIQLEPGASVSAMLDLAENYRIPSEANYRIALRSDWRVVGAGRRDRATTRADATSSLPATTARLLPVVPPVTQRVRPAEYENCTAAQQRDLGVAAERAETLAVAAAAGLAGLAELPIAQRAASPRYTHWFGSWDDTRHDSVNGRFATIADALRAQALAFDCGCDDAGVFAFVYPLRPYQIYLCPVFWSAALDGTDSRAGTLVHELSHFQVVAGTDDHVYTQTRAAELARTDPDLAIANADNYEYFAENTPALEITAGSDVDEGGSPAPDVPVDGAPIADAGTLIPGRRVEGDLSPGERHLFRVEGAQGVQLESLEGDADLAVFDDASLVSPICESNARPPLADSCSLDGEVVWISVIANDATRYALLALAGDDSTESAQPVVATLQPGASSDATIEAGQALRFGLSRVSELTLESIDGDADLYVFEGAVALGDRLLCTANLDSALLDVCDALPSGAELAVVFGYTDASFTLSAGDGLAPMDEDQPVDDEGSIDPQGGDQGDDNDGTFGGLGGSGLVLLALLAGLGGARRLVGVLLAAVSVNACTPAPAQIGTRGSTPPDTRTIDATRSDSARSRAAIITVSMQLVDAPSGRIRVMARNGTPDAAVKLLLWNSPFEAPLSASSVFRVERDGQALDYHGRMVKRGPPVPAAWHMLTAGGVLENELLLGEAYDLTVPGHYVITLLPASLRVVTEPETRTPVTPLIVLPDGPLRFEL